MIGSGCIAALEAEKYLAELEDGDEDNLDKEKTAEKGNSVVVPEYRGNPLL
jgi:thioredoxin reductase (NADPH)